GLLPYVPLLLVAAGVGSGALLARRGAPAGRVLLALAGGWVLGQGQGDWDAGCIGVMGVFGGGGPLVGGAGGEGVGAGGGGGRRLAGRLLIAVAVVGQIALTAYGPPVAASYVYHSPLARWVMDRAPRLYHPVPEVFIERTIHGELLEKDWDDPGRLPIAYAREDGVVTKMLVHPDPESIARVGKNYQTDPEYLAELRRAAENRSGPSCAPPPPGKAQLRAAPPPEPGWWSD